MDWGITGLATGIITLGKWWLGGERVFHCDYAVEWR
ncbi:hypothetical protein T01_15332 [Trichinella spiralis]|uniref:Uncharacterized protein n=1 Tax=Trichinella spiralis TaxID=6334 RepID=A0A0V0YPQ2_TRISP|nr:hypothetical protein T01_15332 [Trichinella spiralis]